MILKNSLISALTLIFLICIYAIKANSEIIDKIVIEGNNRISNETIIMFSDVKIRDDIDKNEINQILKNLYETNFFEDIKINTQGNVLNIYVTENPIIETISYVGIKANKIKDVIFKDLNLKQRSSFNKILLKDDKDKILFNLRKLGYYFSKISFNIENLENNKINLTYNVELGEKAKIKKISFLGNKVFKDRKLRNLIISEEYKFWKFISGKKYLNENMIQLDERLLKNFYLNKGFYNVEIESSFAKLLNENNFELVFTINANNKILFGDIDISLPPDFNQENFDKLNKYFAEVKGKDYSINTVKKILEEIEKVTISEEYQSIQATVNETFVEDKINLLFIISESEKYIVEKINIYGNNVTQESVIRNQFEIDEGDLFNEILQKKTENNLKNLNFFKSVKSEILDNEKEKSKVITYTVEEKPTGEIAAGAGVGTSGGTVMFGVKENNYLGQGLSVNSNLTINKESLKGILSIRNPHFRNSGKAVFGSIEAIETDKFKNSGYKSSKTGLSFGTNFELLDDLRVGFASSNFYEKIETDSTASTQQQAQKGNYFDTFINFDFDYDKRNQKFQTTEGFRSYYSLNLPIISDKNTLTNTYSYNHFSELYEDNISNFSIYLKAANSLTGEDIKLSERLYIPSSKLRGFEAGKVGPKDGEDYVGGNYVSTINFSSTLPALLENVQQMDLLVFFDAANIWGVDYSSSLSDSSKIRSSFGIGIDWFTPIGPLNFSLSQPISKASTDVTETFRFNLGTTF
jgi:outer membrane protein insertion porin family